MAFLLEIITSWTDRDKDKFYLSLRKHNYSVIRELENDDVQANKHFCEYFDTPRKENIPQVEDSNKGWVSVRLAITCSVCMDIFTDPVTLACGHSFCLSCITRTWSEQFEGESSCPHCRQRFKKKPDLKKNLTLCQIAECYRSSQPECGATSHSCTYCTDPAVPPVRACLLCNSLLCNDHLNVHCGASVVLELTASLENRKCSIHNKVLEYFCKDDSCCLCASCCIVGDHRGHQVEWLIDASVRKKQKLRSFQEALVQYLSVLSANIQELKDCRTEMEGESSETELYLCIASNEDKSFQRGPLNCDTTLLKLDSRCISSLVQKMEIKCQEFSEKVEHIENVCNMTEALMVIREPKSESADFYRYTKFKGLVDPFQHFEIRQNTYL